MNELSGCQLCPRLAAHRETVKLQYPDYHCAPVAAFGATSARLLIVGLAPGTARRQCQWATVHRRRLGRSAVRHPARSRFCQPGRSRAQMPTTCNSSIAASPMRSSACRRRTSPDPVKPTPVTAYLQDEISDLPPGGVLLTLGGHRASRGSPGHWVCAMPIIHSRGRRCMTWMPGAHCSVAIIQAATT